MQTNDSLIGTVLKNKYRIDKLLGKGGQGKVYCATDISASIDRQYAIKQFIPNYISESSLKTGIRLFNQEAQILQKLGKHPQIPHIYDYFALQGQFYLVQEWIDGQNLSQEFASKKYFTESETIEFLKDVLTALEFVHQHNYIHRDIKPANLIRNRHGQKIYPIDFGTVKEKLVSENIDCQGNYTRTVIVNSPGYTPKEQLRSNPEFNSDLYALGMVAIQALTGIHPSQIPLDDRDNPIWRAYIPTNTCTYNPNFLNLIDRLVRGDYKERYQSATEVLNDLHRLHLDSDLVLVPESTEYKGDPTTIEPQASAPKTKSLIPWLLTGLGAITIAIAGIWLSNDTEYVIYENTENGIELKHPETWTIRENWLSLQPEVTFIAPLENDTDDFQENVIVSIEELVKPLSLNEYTEQAIAQIEVANTIIEPVKETTFASKEGRRIIYQEKNGNKKRLEVWTIKNQKAYIATYTAEADRFDKFINQVDRIIESLIISNR